MKVVFYMNCVSAHQLPLAKEVAKLVGAENFCYVDAGEKGQEYQTVDVSRFQGFKVSRLEGRRVSEFQSFKVSGFQGGARQRELAEKKVAEWLAGVTRESFVVALESLVEEKAAAGEYRFKRELEKELAIAGAQRFFDEFSRKIIPLRDGRCVYFAPDARSKGRNDGDLSRCWAEYAFHAVSNGGRRLRGKDYNERWYHPHKAANFGRLVETLQKERCFVRLREDAKIDSILFSGDMLAGLAFDVVTRLDEFGNMDANLTEVTFEVASRGEKKLPRLVPLAEAVRTVVHHQTTAGSYPPDMNNIPNSSFRGKGAVEGLRVEKFQGGKVSKFHGEKVSGEDEGREWLGESDVMLTGMRDLELFERRAKKGKRTYYASERWFKPLQIVRLFGLFDCSIGGWVRMIVPGYRRMAKRFVKWANEDEGARVLAVGPWAKKDFLRMGVRAEKIVDWGYFVEPSAAVTTPRREDAPGTVKMLWCGRMLDWKRVETIIRAANELKVKSLKFKVTLVGDGPDKENLIKLALQLFPDDVAIEQSNNSNNRTILFLPSQPLGKIRELMREHDVFVMASNAYEGWGAVVSEALTEGMNVIGTFEAGASATLLPKERLYHCGDVKRLATLLRQEYEGTLPPCTIGDWTPESAARRLIKVSKFRG